MEIPHLNSIKSMEHDPLELNNKLISIYKSYAIYSQDVRVRNEKKFIGSIYHEDELLLRFEYIVLGSYSKDMNVWIWADQSMSFNRNTKKEVGNYRTVLSQNITDENLKKFVNTNYSVLASLDLCKNLYYVSLMISENNKGYCVLTSSRGNI